MADDSGLQRTQQSRAAFLHAAIPSTCDLMGQLTTALGTYHYVADLVNDFFL